MVEAQMTCQGRRLGRNTLHETSVSAYGVDAIVEDFEVGPIVTIGQPFLGEGHSHAGGHPLAQRTSRCFDTRDPMILRMSWSLAIELTKMANVVERDRRLAKRLVIGIHRLGFGETENGPEQNRSMAI